MKSIQIKPATIRHWLVKCSLLTGLLLGQLSSCQGQAPEQFFIKQPWASLLVFSEQLPSIPPPKSRLLWQRSHMTLSLTEHPQAEHLLKQLPSKPMVMVSFSADSPLHSELAASLTTVLFKPATLTAAGLALIESPADEAELVRIASLAHDHRASLPCGRLEAITGLVQQSSTTKHYPPIYADHQHLTKVANMLAQVDQTHILASIETLSAIKTRRYNTPDGVKVANTLTQLANEANQSRLANLTISNSPLSSISSAQQNLIITLPGTSDAQTTVIVGAHMDTILEKSFDQDSSSPGADDDASGLAVILEALRIISLNGASFERTIEFHAYAAEEVGLWGSKDLATSYYTAGRAVAAMLQLDMVLYSAAPADRTIHLVSTDTSSFLRRSLKNLLNNYLQGSYTESALAAGTSDHKSWHSLGFPAVFPFENPQAYNQHIHSPSDTLTHANNGALAARFAQLTLAFLSHHAGLVSAKTDYTSQQAATPLPSDMHLAVLPANLSSSQTSTSPAQWDIAVAAAPELAKIEVCKVTPQLADFACQSPLQALTFVHRQHNRHFFINKLDASFSLTDGEALAVFGYASDDTLVARRTTGLRQNSG